MEEWDVYDKHRIKTGKIVPRGAELDAGEFHLVIHVCILNAEDQMLIQQRQPFKKGWPNLWDVTIGGSALAGESSGVAAARELLEEIGYQADFSNERPAFTVNFPRGFDDFYVLKAAIDLNQLVLQESEVQNVRWASKQEILQMIDKGTFIPYHRSVIDMIFDLQNKGGVHR